MVITRWKKEQFNKKKDRKKYTVHSNTHTHTHLHTHTYRPA